MFAYHGLVPKLIALSPGEQVLLRAHGLEGAPWLSHAAGVAELMLAAVLLLVPRLNWPVMLAAVVLLGLLVDVAVMQPSMLVDAFNPVTLNVAGMVLCAVAWVTRQAQHPNGQRTGDSPPSTRK
nr:DoxX-like family protein [Pseudomonas sp. SLFW]